MQRRTVAVVSTLSAVAAVCAAAALVATGTNAGAMSAPQQQAGPAPCSSSVPYAAGDNGYASFRIPATVTAADGTVLAFAEGRHAGTADSGNIDVVQRRSADGGCTWSPLQIVAKGDGNTRGNPAPAVDPVTKQVVLVTSYNGGTVTESQILQGKVSAADSRRVFVQTSSDKDRKSVV